MTTRRWTTGMVAVLTVLGVGLWGVHSAREQLAREAATLRQEVLQTTQTLTQLREDAATAQRLSLEVNPPILEPYLAPVNRKQAMARLEPLANSLHLRNFTYSLAPAQSLRPEGFRTPVTQSTLTLEADAPQDTHAFRFLERLPRKIPGRLALQSLTLDRMNEESLGLLNVRMQAVLEWTANGGNE